MQTHTQVKLFMILYSGNIGPELSSSNLGMFISSDAGNSWRQVRPHRSLFSALVYKKNDDASVFFKCATLQIFDEEHNIWFLDNGGVLLAVLHAATPIRHLW